MANSIASAYVQILPSTDGMKQNLTNAMNGSATAAGKSGGKTLGQKLKTAIVAAGIGTAITKTISAAFKEGAALQQSIGGVETLFKGSADAVIANAQNAYKTAGMSANQYMETVTSFSASLLQGLGGDTDKAASVADMALIDMSDNANKFGTSMDSINAAYQGFAKGQYTLLDNLKLGYGGTKTEMERLLDDAGKLTGEKYDINNLADVYTAIHAIQGELDITGTTASEASTTIQGSLSAMSASWSNLLGAIATGGNIEEAVRNFAASAVTLATNAGRMITQIVSGIVSALPSLIDAVLAFLPTLADIFIENAPLIVTAGIQLFTGLLQAIPVIIPQLVSALPGMIQQVSDAILQNIPLIITAGIQLFLGLAEALPTAIPEIVAAIVSNIPQIIGVFINAIPDMVSAGVDLIGGLIEGVLQGFKTLIATVTEWSNKVISDVKGIFGIASPSKVFRGIGGYLMEGLSLGITDKEAVVQKAMDGVTKMTNASLRYEFDGGRGKMYNNTTNIYPMTMDDGQQERLMMMFDRKMGALVG